jgi:hypothetical protein
VTALEQRASLAEGTLKQAKDTLREFRKTVLHSLSAGSGDLHGGDLEAPAQPEMPGSNLGPADRDGLPEYSR